MLDRLSDRRTRARLFALLGLACIGFGLTGCVVYDDHPYWHHHPGYYWH